MYAVCVWIAVFFSGANTSHRGSKSHHLSLQINGFTATHITITKWKKWIKISERYANICGRIGATQVSIYTTIKGTSKKNRQNKRWVLFTLAAHPKPWSYAIFSNLLNLPSHGFSVFAINLDFCQNQFIVYYVNWVTLHFIHVDWFFYSYYPVFVVRMLFYLMFFLLFAKCVFSLNKMNLIFLADFGFCQSFDRFQMLMSLLEM